jgi:hypothetical protein
MRCLGGLNEQQAAESPLSWLLSLLPLHDLTPGNKQTGDNENHEGGQAATEVSEESARKPVAGRSTGCTGEGTKEIGGVFRL